MSLFKTTKTTSYSFKSSGNTISEQSDFVSPEVRKPPIGIQTPLRIELGKGLFTMHSDITKVIFTLMDILSNWQTNLPF